MSMTAVIYFNGDYFAFNQQQLDTLVRNLSNMQKLGRIWSDKGSGFEFYYPEKPSKASFRIELIEDNSIVSETTWNRWNETHKDDGTEIEEEKEESKDA